MLDFIGIGAQKSGTTWLHEMLSQHPGIEFPGGKEVHFWDNYRDLGLDWYRALFAGDDRRKGEISPAYACLPIAAIQEIRTEFPEVRLIFIMRNPIERAWSAARMMLARSEMTIDEASEQWFIDHFRSRGSLARGDYAACLNNWLAVFPREQMLIERYESISTESVALLDRCSRFIGSEHAHDFSRHAPGTQIFASEPSELPSSLRAVLQEIYTDKIRTLSACLQEDLSDWI